ncbi:hypothetical protein [Streptomyces sp. NPDC046261]|uniref:hypothetical protein n=1 Tax=Streptomyces sp. NPDC046261 TaxID=3157200 RepID=UPI0033F9406A
MTTAAPRATDPLMECHDIARRAGLAPALTALGSHVLPGLLPCGPGGHTIAPQDIYARAGTVWIAGVTRARRPGRDTVVSTADLPGGGVVMAAVAADGPPAEDTAAGDDGRAPYALGLVWLRLGLSEALRDSCLSHLGRRRTGDTYVLQQQMVKGTLADVLVEHLEVRAVLEGTEPEAAPPALLHHLHGRLTRADREQVRLLGAAGYLTDSPGMTAYVSELLAEVHSTADDIGDSGAWGT